MSKKNPFEGLVEKRKSGGTANASDFPMMGAGRSIMGAIDELAKQADKLVDGETVVELDTAEIDPSFIQDRLGEGEDFDEFVRSIETNEQQTPALVRPHPDDPKRYMLVFGRRRWKAAKKLKRKLRTVIKDLTETEHVILQGQENSARSNLSYLEKAIYARKLSERDYETATMLAALSCDKSALSKLLSVASIPSQILDHFGAGHSIGRDRLYDLKKLLDRPGNVELAVAKLTGISELSAAERLSVLINYLKTLKRGKRLKSNLQKIAWTSCDKSIMAHSSGNKRKFLISLNGDDRTDVSVFGDYLSDKLPELYAQFLKQKNMEDS